MSKTRLILRIIVTVIIGNFAYEIFGHYGVAWSIVGGVAGVVAGWYISQGVTSFIAKSDVTRHR